MIFKNSNLIRRVLFSRLVEYLFQIFVRPENVKKSRPKKLVRLNKSISRKIFGQIPFFAFSKMATRKNVILQKKNKSNQINQFSFFAISKQLPKIIFLTGKKSLKLPKMHFHKKMDLFDISRIFLPRLF